MLACKNRTSFPIHRTPHSLSDRRLEDLPRRGPVHPEADPVPCSSHRRSFDVFHPRSMGLAGGSEYRALPGFEWKRAVCLTRFPAAFCPYFQAASAKCEAEQCSSLNIGEPFKTSI